MRQPRYGLVWPVALLLGVAACETQDSTLEPDQEVITMPGEEGVQQDPAAFTQEMNQNLDNLDQQLADHRQRAVQDGTVPETVEQQVQQIENEIQQLRQRLANLGQQQGTAFEQESQAIEREYQQLQQRVMQLEQEPSSKLQR